MKTPLRVHLRAIACAIASSGCGWVGEGRAAESESNEDGKPPALPGIFAPKRAMEPPAPPTLLARRLMSSDKVSAMIKERVAERTKELDMTALPITRRTDEVSPMVVMEKFSVSADKVRRVDPDEKLSPVARFLKTGRVFESRDGSTTGDVRLLPVRPSGALPKEDVMRVEVSVTKKF